MDRVSFGSMSALDDSVAVRVVPAGEQPPSYILPLAIIGGVIGAGILLYYATKKSK